MSHERPDLPGHLKASLVTDLRKHNRKFFAPNARDPIHLPAQQLLKAAGKLSQDVIASGVTGRVIDRLEVVNITQDEG